MVSFYHRIGILSIPFPYKMIYYLATLEKRLPIFLHWKTISYFAKKSAAPKFRSGGLDIYQILFEAVGYEFIDEVIDDAFVCCDQRGSLP